MKDNGTRQQCHPQGNDTLVQIGGIGKNNTAVSAAKNMPFEYGKKRHCCGNQQGSSALSYGKCENTTGSYVAEESISTSALDSD